MGVSNWIALANVLLTTVLTAIIIRQTNRLNKQQLAFERDNHQRALDLQKRQIQIETVPYKREIYSNVFAIFECCHFLKDVSTKIDLTQKTGKELSDMFSLTCKGYVPDIKDAIWSLREAEYILPANIAIPVLEIRSCFDKVCANFNCLASIESILTSDELQTLFQGIKEDNVYSALSNCDKILSYVSYIESIMPVEINIANLNR